MLVTVMHLYVGFEPIRLCKWVVRLVWDLDSFDDQFLELWLTIIIAKLLVLNFYSLFQGRGCCFYCSSKKRIKTIVLLIWSHGSLLQQSLNWVNQMSLTRIWSCSLCSFVCTPPLLTIVLGGSDRVYQEPVLQWLVASGGGPTSSVR